MPTYKFTYISGSYYLKNYPDLASAQSALKPDYTVALSDEQIPDITAEERQAMDEIFGNSIIEEFLVENKTLLLMSGSPLSAADALLLDAKFADLRQFCRAGSIVQAQELLDALAVDLFFTQQRKTYYLDKMNEYLAQYL